MEPEKHTNSETSSADSAHHDQPEKPNDDGAAAGVGRSYECNFCKRGFTNAQALGGHMNIHRKDKAKAKAKQKNQSIHSYESNENYKNLSCFPQVSYTSCNNPVLGGHVNYQVHLPLSSSSSSSYPSFQTGNTCQYNYFPMWRPDLVKDCNMDANLSLRIGLRPPVEDHGEEVDLELRLGQYP